MAVWWRRRSPPGIEAPDPRVPAFADWSRRGIVGTIGSGLVAGGTVMADPVVGEGGRFAGHWLLLPVPNLCTESGEHVMDDCVFEPRAVPGRERRGLRLHARTQQRHEFGKVLTAAADCADQQRDMAPRP